MKNETKKIIRTAVKNFLASKNLTAYHINKIVKAEVTDPASWGVPGDNDMESCVRRYYENIKSMNVFVNFQNRLALRYGV